MTMILIKTCGDVAKVKCAELYPQIIIKQKWMISILLKKLKKNIRAILRKIEKV